MAYVRFKSAWVNIGKFIHQLLTETKTLIRTIGWILIKLYRQNVSLLFNIYIYIYIYIHHTTCENTCDTLSLISRQPGMIRQFWLLKVLLPLLALPSSFCLRTWYVKEFLDVT